MKPDGRDQFLEAMFRGHGDDDLQRDAVACWLACPTCGADVAVAAGAVKFHESTGLPLLATFCRAHRPTRRQLLAEGVQQAQGRDRSCNSYDSQTDRDIGKEALRVTSPDIDRNPDDSGQNARIPPIAVGQAPGHGQPWQSNNPGTATCGPRAWTLPRFDPVSGEV